MQGCFRTPIAAVFFAMEVLTAGALELNALFPCLIAAFTASYTSNLLGLEKFNMNLGIALEPSLMLFGKVVLLGIVFGVAGGVFAHVLNDSKAFFSNKIKNPISKDNHNWSISQYLHADIASGKIFRVGYQLDHT